MNNNNNNNNDPEYQRIFKHIEIFYNLTMEEIYTLIEKWERIEYLEDIKKLKEKLENERIEDKKYIKSGEDKNIVDPTHFVKIDKCIKVPKDKLDDNGYITEEELKICKIICRLSMARLVADKFFYKGNPMYLGPRFFDGSNLLMI